MLGMLAMGHSDSAAWPAACLAGEPSCVSWGLWMLAALCWIAARSLLSCECPGKGHRQPSVLCLLYSSLGHICNTVGALLASQLGIQILTGAYMAVADVVRFLLTLFPPCPPESRKTAGLPRRRRRWQRLRGGLLALTLPLSVGAGRSLLVPGPRPSRGQLKGAWRRLLGAVFEDNREALGFVLGLLSAFVALTARIPALLRAGEAMPVEAAVGHPLLGRSQRPLRSSDCHLQPAACARPEGPALAPDCPGLGCTGCGPPVHHLHGQEPGGPAACTRGP
ncbi:transmembrane protein 44 isoform X4 [Accipiter gentilis]|uniref:transmembrane protein 44 isoform X4 n=1 Tax=Astur gentilis TaxID=8957 RepID=UPI002110255F|nr:transmembrane protein 44 isoform X4 [Accipiter gentilis]XP_049658469.1 transmembrane protein 44 isoform X4 [Accipiter gentilis]